MRLIGFTSFLTAASLIACAGAKEDADGRVSIGAASGGLESLMTGGRAVKLPREGGGFSARNAAGQDPIGFSPGQVKRSAGKVTFSCEKSGDLKLSAEFADHGEYILVSGSLENLRKDDRGVVLDYRIPFAGEKKIFGNDLDRSVVVTGTETEGNVYPLAAMIGSDTGLALAIPPTAPCEFGMVGSSAGLTVRFYLGLSSETRNFPNRAPFSFLIYPVNSGWGFRSALSKYYSFYPEYYTNRSGRDGQFLFLAEDHREPTPAQIGNYSYTCVETQAPWLQQFLDRDRQNGIFSLPYMIVGMREIKYLKELPKTYDQAMQAYAHWSLADQAGFPITKEGEAADRDVNLRAEVDGSTCFTADGRPAITIRHTPWGLNSVTFKTNPNPDLFADTHGQSVGRNAINLIDRWSRIHPEADGVTIDSLGGNWPANFNYRRDHFRYARYPLTCDSSGRVALHNEISHYEFLETLRNHFRSSDSPKSRYIAANGIYSYAVRPDLPQHYRTSTAASRISVGRFFLGSLLDFAVSEPGISSAQSSLEFMRVSMGRKVYSPTNANWHDAAKVRDWFNKCLCYGLFAVNVRRSGDQIQYYYPEFQRRDQDLIDWFVPKVRLLSRAGWQPVTAATTDGQKVFVERYGSGDTVYFALLSEHSQEQTCILTMDLDSLGFKSSAVPPKFLVDEIAQGAPVRTVGPNQIALALKPFRTCIVAVRKS